MRIRLNSDLVYRRHVYVPITVVVEPFDIWRLYAGLGVIAMLILFERNSGASDSVSLHLLVFLKSIVFFQYLGKVWITMNSSRWNRNLFLCYGL